MVRPWSCRIIYYFDTPALGIRNQSFDRVSASLGISGAWVMAPDSRGIGQVSGPIINGSRIKTQFY